VRSRHEALRLGKAFFEVAVLEQLPIESADPDAAHIWDAWIYAIKKHVDYAAAKVDHDQVSSSQPAVTPLPAKPAHRLNGHGPQVTDIATLATTDPRLRKVRKRCLRCDRAAAAERDRDYGSRWRRARARFLRSNPCCRYCEALGLAVQATEVDHIKPHRGDRELFWDESNWQPLCKPCHDGAKAELERTGHLRGCSDDGVPVDPAHAWAHDSS
jgi:5-methylcytosine-specific restriction endonuclease McrA